MPHLNALLCFLKYAEQAKTIPAFLYVQFKKQANLLVTQILVVKLYQTVVLGTEAQQFDTVPSLAGVVVAATVVPFVQAAPTVNVVALPQRSFAG